MVYGLWESETYNFLEMGAEDSVVDFNGSRCGLCLSHRLYRRKEEFDKKPGELVIVGGMERI